MPNGRSTVDYSISRQSLFKNILSFHVEDPNHLSDHAPICLNMKNWSENFSQHNKEKTNLLSNINSYGIVNLGKTFKSNQLITDQILVFKNYQLIVKMNWITFVNHWPILLLFKFKNKEYPQKTY